MSRVRTTTVSLVANPERAERPYPRRGAREIPTKSGVTSAGKCARSAPMMKAFSRSERLREKPARSCAVVERFRFDGLSGSAAHAAAEEFVGPGRERAAERSPPTVARWDAQNARGPGIRRGLSAIRVSRLSASANVRRLRTFSSRTGVKLHLLTILKGTEPFRNDVAVMNEQILAPIVGSDESVTLLVTEPLHGATSQDLPPPNHIWGPYPTWSNPAPQFDFARRVRVRRKRRNPDPHRRRRFRRPSAGAASVGRRPQSPFEGRNASAIRKKPV